MRMGTAVMVVLLLGLAGMAVAAPPEPGADEARAHYKKGTSLYALGRYAEAATEYEKAFELRSDPALLYNAAQAHRLADNKPRALLLYQNYLRLFADRVQNRDEVERHIVRLKTALAQERAALAQEKAAQKPETLPPSPPPPVEARPPAPSAAVVAMAPPRRSERPLVKRPWFWGVVAGGVAVVALGVGLGVGLGTFRDPKPSLGMLTWN
jgi:tetratricopeptide (TPR) repeat protein